jgi:hypothetical protein
VTLDGGLPPMSSGVALGGRCTHEIALSDFYATLANDVVSRCGVEVEVGQAVAKQQALTCELSCLPAREGDADLLGLGAVDLALLDAPEVIDSLGDPIFQLSNRGLVVGKFQKLFAGQTPRRICGVIGSRPNLSRQIEHVGR